MLVVEVPAVGRGVLGNDGARSGIRSGSDRATVGIVRMGDLLYGLVQWYELRLWGLR